MRGCSGASKGFGGVSKVFPAYAGMFLDTYPRHERYVGFPRVCGDVPANRMCGVASTGFSPRMRGCSGVKEALANIGQVFPAYAGMFLMEPSYPISGGCFPRVCGDVPAVLLTMGFL